MSALPAGPVEIGPGRTLPASALSWRVARSSGPGGQNVNKVATKVHLYVELHELEAALGPAALRRLVDLAGPAHVTDSGRLRLTVEETRSQQRNRQIALERLRMLVVRALTPPKPRRPTRPSRGARERRLEGKRQRSEAKERRRPPRLPP